VGWVGNLPGGRGGGDFSLVCGGLAVCLDEGRWCLGYSVGRVGSLPCGREAGVGILSCGRRALK
jgi:hypothetical protein